MSENRTHGEILRAAAARIEDRRHFVMGAKAWNARGREVAPTSPEARRWNALGAILVEGGSERLYEHVQAAARVIAEEIDQRNLLSQDTADNLGHARTIRALEDAARAADAELGIETIAALS